VVLVSDGLRQAAVASGVAVDDFTAPISRHVVVAGHRLHLLDWSSDSDASPSAPDRPTIIFLHGTALTAHTWDIVAMSLRQQARCIAVDLRGHGDSEWSPVSDYRINTFVKDIGTLLTDVIGEPALLVGMSLGGLVAAQCAVEYADLVAGVVIVDIGPESERRFQEGFKAQQEGAAKRLSGFLAQPAEMDSVEDFVQRALEFNPRRNPEALRGSLLNNLRELPSGRWAWKYDRSQFGQQPQSGPDGPWAGVETMRCPALVVRGAESEILSAAGAAELADRLPSGRWVEVPGAGHSVQVDNPAGLLEVLRPFLADVGVHS
jgi:esterase